MSKLNFSDCFNQIKAAGNTIPISSATRSVASPSQEIGVDAARKQFIRLFNQTGRHLRRWDVFTDFIALAASELDMAQMLAPESVERRRKINARYDADDIAKMQELFWLMVCALEAKFHDFLGAIFMELELGSGGMGQYFTPYPVQSMMAKMMLPGVEDVIRREGIVTVSDPASGAGGMILAYAEHLLDAGYNPSMQMFGSCIDIDHVAADMSFIQLSLLGIAAEVVTGNTLTMHLTRVRYTPVYYLNDFRSRLDSQERVKRMIQFMRGLNIAA